MKYLKKFNESVDDTLMELQDFCETSLAYLLDDDFEVNVTRIRPKRLNYFSISIGKSVKESRILQLQVFKWDDIKDQIIPFLTHLSKRHELKSLDGFPPIEFYFREGTEPTRNIYISLEDILSETGDTMLLSKEDSIIIGMWIKIKVKI